MKRSKIIFFLFALQFFIGCNNNTSENSKEKLNDDKKNNSEVKIGSQIWMTTNLNVDRFQNGDIIQEARNLEEWNSLNGAGQPAWSYYEYKESNGNKYGKLYNHAAVNDIRKLAPKGWHIPSETEWIELKNYVNSSSTKLKSTSGWIENGTNGNGSNESGFTALPSGYRGSSGFDDLIGTYAQWWASDSLPHLFFRSNSVRITNSSDDIFTDDDAGYGFSVRCIKD